MKDITRRFHRGNAESVEAHESIEETKEITRLQIIRFIYKQYARGATCEEVELALGLSHQTVSARITEAKVLKEIAPTGYRRPTRSGRGAAIYVDPSVLW